MQNGNNLIQERQQRASILQSYLKNVNQINDENNSYGRLKEQELMNNSGVNSYDHTKQLGSSLNKQDNNPYRKKMYNNMSNSSFTKKGNTQPLKAVYPFQNISNDINIAPQNINIKSLGSTYHSNNNNQCDKQDITKENPIFDNDGKQTDLNQQYLSNSNYSTNNASNNPVNNSTNNEFQSTSKFNETFKMSKDSVQMSENNTNIEEMHYYAVDFQQNCKKWLSKIEQQF